MLDDASSRMTNLVGRRARRAAFVEHVHVVGGKAGTEELANEGRDAHRVSSELQGIAREGSPAQTKAVRRTQLRSRVVAAVAAMLFAVSIVWVVDNVVGYARSSHAQLTVRGDHTVQLASGTVAHVDCWTTGSVQEVWRAAAPYDQVAPYRCGDTPMSMVAGGVMSTAAVALSVLSLLALLALAVRRRRTNFWY